MAPWLASSVRRGGYARVAGLASASSQIEYRGGDISARSGHFFGSHVDLRRRSAGDSSGLEWI